jgi:hypothetical protein
VLKRFAAGFVFVRQTTKMPAPSLGCVNFIDPMKTVLGLSACVFIATKSRP